MAYPEWSTLGDITGIHNQNLLNYKHDENINIKIKNTIHPITKDLSDWTMVDERYLMENASEENNILLITDLG